MDLYVCFHFFLLELIICSCSIEGFCTKTADLLSCFLYIISLCEVKVKWLWKSLSCVQLLATPWTAAYQAPPSMGFSRQEYWSGVPLPSPGQNTLVGCKESDPAEPLSTHAHKHLIRVLLETLNSCLVKYAHERQCDFAEFKGLDGLYYFGIRWTMLISCHSEHGLVMRVGRHVARYFISTMIHWV